MKPGFYTLNGEFVMANYMRQIPCRTRKYDLNLLLTVTY